MKGIRRSAPALAGDWHRFAAPLREKYGDELVDEAVARLEAGNVWNYHGKIGVRLRGDLGDDRSKLGAANYWPTGDGEWDEFHCMCQRMRRKGCCSHALAAHMYRERQAEVEDAA